MSLPDRIAVLNTDGTEDTSFAPVSGLNAPGLCVAVMGDGVIVAGGEFTVAANAARLRLAFFNPNGTLRADTLNTNWDVNTLARQADGKIIIGGKFTMLGGVTRNRLARMKADRTLEAAFDPDANGSVYAAALTEEGKIYVGGGFTGMGTRARSKLARLFNDEAPQALTVLSADSVIWMRGGASGETGKVSFEVDTGSGYGALGGTVARIAGGWQVTGLALSGDGTIRARAFPSDSHSGGMIEEEAAFDFSPLIQIRVNGIVKATGSTLTFPDVQNGSSHTLEIAVGNIGLADLTLTGTPVTKGGTNPGEWEIVAQPATPVEPDAVAVFLLKFAPTSTGDKVATLSIASNDAASPFVLNLAGECTPGPGSQDSTWQPLTSGGLVNALAANTANVLLGGAFTAVNGQLRPRWARVSHAGALVTQTGAGANGPVLCVQFLPDGGWLLGGSFTTFNGLTRRGLCKVKADGTLDSAWNTAVAAGASIDRLAVQPDGKVLVGGSFAITQSGETRSNLARLNADGTLDASFSAIGVDSTRKTPLWVDSQGRIFVVGSTTGGVIRLLNTGARDSGFASLAVTPGGSKIHGLAVTPAGQVLIGGEWTHVGGTAHAGVAKLTTAGALDVSYVTGFQDGARGVLLQSDGLVLAWKLVLNTLLRSTATGTADASFVPPSSLRTLYGVCGTPSGKLITAVAGGDTGILRLANSAVTSTLSVSGSAAVVWLRGGAVPECMYATLDVSEDAGQNWTALGVATSVTGGWQWTGLPLPRNGRLRARAWLPAGGVHEETLNYTELQVPDIGVELGVTSLVDGGAVQFTGCQPGQTSQLTLTVRNTGNATLSAIAATVSGSTEFEVTSLASGDLQPGQTKSLVITFKPVAVGYRSAVLYIASNAPGLKNPFALVLNGSGTAAPTAATTSATLITSSAARLRGTVKANADAAKAFVEYKRTIDSVWTRSALVDVAGFTPVTVQIDVSGLQASTAYHYRTGVYNDVITPSTPALGANVNFNTTA